MSAPNTTYLWIAILGGIFGFFYGFLIGANDVANAFASSVSARSLTLKQAVLVASICEFTGAFFLGASVTSTVRSKLFDVELYADEPYVLMFGMFTSLLSANLMLFIATYFGMPVSTTHDVVGCILGFTISAKGFHSVDWSVIKKIIISWIASPLLSGAFAAIIFGAIKYLVMRAKNPYQRAYYTFPVILTIGIGIDLFYILYKGTSNFKEFQEKVSLKWVLPTSFGVGAFCGLVWIFILGPFARKRVEAQFAARDAAIVQAETDKADAEADKAEAAIKAEAAVNSSEDDDEDSPKREQSVAVEGEGVGGEDPVLEQAPKWYKNMPWDQDLHAQSMHESPRAAEIWDEQENFDENAEGLFNYIQVFTACLNSFAHGANDVANTIAPMSAVIEIYQTGAVNADATVQKWVLAFGGIAIILGLALYGYRVMKSLGYKLTKLSPSRGASAELGASLTVVTASFLGIPISSTQCIVGAVTGVGMFGGKGGIQWLFLLKVCCSWAVLFICCVLLSAGVFSFAAYSPDLNPNA
ncbi:hypothetical protein MPSEU_000657800 [Mayamaea pseudoterrestris]|nr:hypothetical protein MPSEU_000657800 [Mayamaea pseudoterrestris]